MRTLLHIACFLIIQIMFVGPALCQTVITMPAPPKSSVQPAEAGENLGDATDGTQEVAAEVDPLGVTAITRYARARVGSDYTYGMTVDPLRGRYVRSYGWPYVYSPAVFYGSGGLGWGWGFGRGWFGGGGHGGHHGGHHGGWWCGPTWTIDITID